MESGQTAAELLKKGIPARYADLGETYAHEESLSRDDLGHLHPGARAEVLLWDVASPLELVYWMGESYLPERVR